MSGREEGVGPAVGRILCIMLMIAGAADLCGFFGSTGASGAFALMGGAAAAELIFGLLRKKWDLSLLRFGGKLLIIAVLLELTLFQYPSYRSVFGSGEETVLLSGAQGEEYQGRDNTPLVLTFDGVGVPVDTVWVDISFDGDYTEAVAFTADISDEACAEPRLKIIESQIIRGSSQSAYAIAQLSGKAGTVRLSFTGSDYGDLFTVRSVVLNRTVPFDVSPLRVLLILLGGMLLHGLLFSVRMGRPFSREEALCRTLCAIVTGAAVLGACAMCLSLIPEERLSDAFRRNEGDQLTQEMTLAFEEGRTYIYELEPDDPLLQMEDPYDWSARSSGNVPYSWDHVLYGGRYYSYYGVAPLLLFVPYHLATGHFFPAEIAVMLFSACGLILLALTYLAVVRRWFSEIPAGSVLAGLIVLLAACGIWFCTGRPKFYETAISSGFCCAVGGALLLIGSGAVTGEKLRPVRLAGASLLLGLAVLCRPTMAVYAACGAVWAVWGALSRKKGRLTVLLCGLLPMAAAAAFQMWYNYDRFGDVLEFGIRYSLTVNDFTHTQFHLHFVLISLYNFLIAPPAFIPDYPYITAPFSMLGVNGYYFKDYGAVSGLFFRGLTSVGILAGGRAIGGVIDRKTRIKWGVLAGLPCVIAPLVIVISTWESGYAVRYAADFSWAMLLGGTAALFALSRGRAPLRKLLLRWGMALAAVMAVLVNGIQALTFAYRSDVYPLAAERLRRLFELWL
ncbi:MAG: hypothetical protein IJ071_00460 [Ruminococcus sp.]|nr:hypothetical protein [Ruminococcus sp.]